MAKKSKTRLEWRNWDIEEGRLLAWRLGPLRLWASLGHGEWKLAWRRDGAGNDSGKAPIEEEEWQRCTAGRDADALRLAPVLPDLPLVAKPRSPFRVLPGEQARVFVSVPVWVRVSTPIDPPLTLAEIPTVELSRTWSGSPTEGRISYWTRTRARCGFDASEVPEHVVTAPLVLSNRSGDPLLIEKTYLRLPFLSVYSRKGALWTDTSHIVYKGPGEYETVQEEGEPPEEAPGSLLLSPPRSKPKSGLAMLSFSPLKALSEWAF